ncbi:hypothetical protein MAJJADAN_00024 [Pseudomonas phage Amjad_SA]|nr:hypothetical protein MAJJADAN_00024 [Pseudomonas phage Amjad_SA]
MASVAFDPVAFKLAYPEFAAATDPFLESCFDQATLYLSNGDCSPITDLAKREKLLWMLTAHIAQLRGALNPAGPGGGPGLVGRVSSATEGSVSVSTEFPMTPSSAWFNQTTYGAMFWQATLSLRSFRYRARPTQVEGLGCGTRWR